MVLGQGQPKPQPDEEPDGGHRHLIVVQGHLPLQAMYGRWGLDSGPTPRCATPSTTSFLDSIRRPETRVEWHLGPLPPLGT